MALGINGYNDNFQAFVDFATKSVEAGKSKAIARTPVEVTTGPLTGRSITAATTDKAKAFASLGAEGATGLATRDIKPGSGDSVQRRCDFRSRHSRRSHELTFNQQTLRRIKHGYKG